MCVSLSPVIFSSLSSHPPTYPPYPIQGVARGTDSLVRHTVGGMANSAAGITDNISKQLSNLAFDKECRYREREKNPLSSTHPPTHPPTHPQTNSRASDGKQREKTGALLRMCWKGWGVGERGS